MRRRPWADHTNKNEKMNSVYPPAEYMRYKGKMAAVQSACISLHGIIDNSNTYYEKIAIAPPCVIVL